MLVRERASKAIGFAKMLRKVRKRGGRERMWGEGETETETEREKQRVSRHLFPPSPQDLEIAADFSLCVSVAELLAILKASDHTRVVLPHQRGKLVFVPEHMEDSVE